MTHQIAAGNRTGPGSAGASSTSNGAEGAPVVLKALVSSGRYGTGAADALAKAHAHPGLSLIHVPVYYGADPAGGMGAYGQWNVGPWSDSVQETYTKTLI
ncbi:hypothetical protein [Paraburkholderia sp. 31.1]|uniref:hypothetical protein n=1 Tax=Paraburkholderia sp. 31.1 TaxID=2615205 RepID=UPI001654D8B8|nr:hypothetical protein [Paraburkholderia sp. 31.1]